MADEKKAEIAYKVMTAEQWNRLQTNGFFSGAPVDIHDGYIHLSTAEQLRGTVDKHFEGQVGLILLEVKLAAVGNHIRWEPSRGGALFPHLYGGLPMAAVGRHWVLDADRNGKVLLPKL